MDPTRLPTAPGAAPDWALAPGCARLERYLLGPELGRGGMGRVLEAWDPMLKRVVAIKLLHGNDPETLLRFLREAQTQARLEHPHICRILDMGQCGDTPYIAMQRLHGLDLSQLRPELGHRDMARILADVASAVHAAHRAGLIHRDLKPSNVLVERLEDGSFHPYVVDFGLARDLSAPDFTLSWAAMGTPAFMSPEQARCEKLGPAADLYSLGATMYALLSGQPPYESATLAGLLTQQSTNGVRAVRKLNPTVPKDLETITLKCLEEDPARRYESAFALEEDLRRYLAGEPILARPVGPFGRLWRWAKRRPALSATLAASLVVIALLGAWNLRTLRQARIREQVAQRFALEIRDAEHLLRIERMLPIHDIRPAEARLRKRMEIIRAEMGKLGGIAKGPGLYALGRGHLALREVDPARETLMAAWEAGFQAPEVAYAIGMAHVRSYDAKEPFSRWYAIKGSSNGETHRKWLEPAKTWLDRAEGASVESPAFAEGMAAMLGGHYGEAETQFARALEEAPWMHEAWLERARNQYLEGSFQGTTTRDPLAHFKRLGAIEGMIRRAEAMAPSDVEVQVQLSSLSIARWMIMSARGSRDPALLVPAEEALRAGLRIQPGSEELRVQLSQQVLQGTFCRFSRGEDTAPATLAHLKEVESALQADRFERIENRNSVLSIAHHMAWMTAEADLRFGRDPGAALEAAARWRARLPQQDVHHAFPMLVEAQWRQQQGLSPMPKLQETQALVEQCLKTSPEAGHPFFYSILGEARRLEAAWRFQRGEDARGAAQATVAALERGVAIDPSLIYLYYELPRALVLLARIQEKVGASPEAALAKAREAAGKGVSINPKNAMPQFAAAEAYLAQAQLGATPDPWLARARAALEAGEATNPRHFWAKHARAEVELEAARLARVAGQPAEPFLARARKACREGLALNGRDPGLRKLRQRLLVLE